MKMRRNFLHTVNPGHHTTALPLQPLSGKTADSFKGAAHVIRLW